MILYIKMLPKFWAVNYVDIPEQCSEIHDGQFLCNLLLLLQPLGLVHPTQYNIIKD